MSFLTDEVIVERATRWLEAQGYDVDRNLVVDGDPVRLKEPGYDKGRPVSVKVFSDPPKVSCRNYHGDGDSSYSYLDTYEEWRSRTPDDRAKALAERKQKRDARAATDLEKHEQAAKKAQATLAKATDVPNDFPYLVRKGVRPCKGLKLGKAWKPQKENADGTVEPGHKEDAILMPLQDLDGRVWSYQAIFADGTKSHMPGGRARGLFFVVPATPENEGGVKAFLEGLATGLTVNEAIGVECIVCCDCGNLLPVASDFVGHGMLGDVEHDENGVPIGLSGGVLLADNDHATKRPHGHARAGQPWNPGLEAVQDASRVLCMRYQYPRILDGAMDAAGGKALTDYNDLAAVHGIDAVRTALDTLLPAELDKEPERQDADNTPGNMPIDMSEPPIDMSEPMRQNDATCPPACPDKPIDMLPPGEKDDSPIPLRRPTGAQADYPTEVFGPLSGAVEALSKYCSVHPSVAGGAVLTYLSMLAQRIWDVRSERYSTPLSLYFMMIMDSGEGKSDVERIAGHLIRKWEAEREPQYKEARREWELATKIYEKAVAKAGSDFTKSKISEDEYKQLLKDLQAREPVEPLAPILTSGDVNVEGIYRMLRDGRPSHAIFAAEGGRLFGGIAFSAENKLKTISALADLWSGAPLDKLRQGEGASKLADRRIAVSLMLQPVVAEPLYGDPTLSQQGFLSRFLTTWPRPQRRRFYNVDVTALPEMGVFYDTCWTLLNIAPPDDDVPGEGLKLDRLDFTGKALDIFSEYQERIEDEIDLDGDSRKYDMVRRYAKRSAEQAVRLAGVLTVAWNPHSRQVDPQAMESGCRLAKWYLDEILRISLDDLASPEVRRAEELLDFLWKKKITLTSTRQILRFGPAKLREKKAVDEAVKTLEDHKWLKRSHAGDVWMGDNRPAERARTTWIVVPETAGK